MPAADSSGLCVAPGHFAENRQHLQRHYQVISLQQLSQALRDDRLPRRAAVVTFDDGYADHMLQAKPLL